VVVTWVDASTATVEQALTDDFANDVTPMTSLATPATRIVYDPSTGTLSFDPDGSGAAASQPFAVLDDPPPVLPPDDIWIGP
jgi:Ca2+-binding RTX toxin-like protein